MSGPDHVAEFAVERGDDAFGVVDAERRLRHVGDRRVGRKRERVDILFVLHQQHLARDLAERALDLGVTGMADQNDRAALTQVMPALRVHF